MQRIKDQTTYFKPSNTAILDTGYLEKIPFFISADGNILLGDQHITSPDPEGTILCSHKTSQTILIGTDTGKLYKINKNGQQELLYEDKGKWIDNCAMAQNNIISWSIGKTAYVQEPGKAIKTYSFPSTIGGLVFAPKGVRLAVSHYNGVSLWYPNTHAAPEFLEWKGSHLNITWSPDGEFILTSMQEPQLHGWRIKDHNHMRMSGYPTKVRSMSWSNGGKYLATSGANELILWPFLGKDGPIGKQPLVLSQYHSPWTRVSCHPNLPVVAAGNTDGRVIMVKIDDGSEVELHEPQKSPISALAWRSDGSALNFGTQSGIAATINF